MTTVKELFYYLNVDKHTATRLFESLSSGIRLDAYRLLVRYGREGLVAGQIATTLDVSPANLSFHLKAMTHVGLVSVEQEGRFQRYRANLALMFELVAYLTAECCAAQPGPCTEPQDALCCAEGTPPAAR